MAQAQQEEEEEFDPRLDFIMNYLIRSIRIKPEKWIKMMNTDEFKVIVRDFLDEPIHEVLVLSMGGAGLLIPVLGFPPAIKTKACYFIRIKKERVTKDNFRNILIFGDMSPKPVHDLYGMVDEVFIPLLTSQPGWPQVVVEDVREHMYRMKNATYEMIGKMEGKTLLPMPMGVERVHEVQQAIISSGGQDVDLALKRAIEQMVVKWGAQVKEILNQNSSSVFEKTLHPAPSEEIDFWNARLKNLESIYHQLRDPSVAKMASILELTESVYCKNYKELFINVFEAVLESREISAFMKALKPQFDVIESTDFNEVRPHLKPLMHVVCLTWGYCRHYCNNTRIILLLREICNMLVQQASKYLDPGSLFQGETEESLARVVQCIESLHIFRQIFEESRQNIASYFPEDVQPQYWNFGGSLVFEYMDKFIERLNAVKDLFATSLEFQKLEKVEVGGIRARWLSPRIESIFAEFEELYSFFSGVPYDPLDPDDSSFEKDYSMFRRRIRDFDDRLAAICSQAFDDCVNIEAILKFISMMGSLLDREVIKASVEPKYHRLYDLLHSELDTVKAMFDKDLKCYKEKGEIPIDNNFPPVAGTIMRIIMLRERISPEVTTLKALDHPLAETEEANYIYKKYDEMLSYLERFERLIFRKWAAQVPRICNENLEKTLMIRRPDMSLTLNFDQELTTLLCEVRYLNMMGEKNLPQEALDLYARNEELRSWIFELNATMEWYNEIRRISSPIEFEIISDEVEEIDFLIQEALDTLNWNSFMVSVYIEKMHDMIKCLNDRLKMAQANIEHIISMIEPWTIIPLYERKDGRKEALICLEDRHNRLEKRYNEIKRAGITIHEIMTRNFNLFFNIIPEEEKLEEEEQEEEEEEEGIEGEEVPVTEEVAGTEAPEGPDAHEEEDGEEPKRKKSKKMVEEPIEKDVGIELLGVKTGKAKKQEPEWKLEEFEFDDEEKPPEEEPPPEVKPLVKEKRSKGDLKKKGKKKSVEVSPPGGKKPAPGARSRPPPEPEPEPEVEEVEEEEELELTESELFLQQRRAEKWEPYVEFVDDLVFEGLQATLICSISLFLDQMDPDSGAAPLFTVSLVLKEPELMFIPSLDTNDPNGFYKLVESLIKDIMRMSFLIERVSKNPEKLRYKHELEANEELIDMRQEMMCHVQLGMDEAIEYCKRFQEYAHLWSDDRQKFLQQFITYGHALTPEEVYLVEAGIVEDNPNLQKNPPTLPKFKEQIDHFDEQYATIEKMDPTVVFLGWFQVNLQPFKETLLVNVSEWSKLLKQHLENHVIHSLQELSDFIAEANKVLLTPVDYDVLPKIMIYLNQVKERSLTTDQMFEPIKETINLLKNYGVEFSDEVHQQLQNLPEMWNTTMKIATVTKMQATPFINAESTLIREKLKVFDLKQSEYLDSFRKLPLYKYTCVDEYNLMNTTNNELQNLEAQLEGLKSQADLFEVNVPEFKQISVCRKDLAMLKTLWDYINVVRSNIDDWKTTRWKEIDVEAMDQECKKFGKSLRGLDKEMRVWDAYISLEATLKNLLTSLRAVTELQNPAIRERHWKQLMEATKVKFHMDASTTLADLLALNLHKYEEEVKNIVDKSVKEMSMEKVLKELHATWSTMEFEREIHPRTGCTLLRASEELIETLEDNQVQLQNLMGSKYIAYFLEEVSDWRTKLSNADQVISIWFEVQRTWTHLESIFVGSEDIRNQLPEDSQRFDRIDREFRDLLSEVTKTPNVIAATNRYGLYDKLENLQQMLVLCEKALAQYLETKRLAYPRFYFVSSADLLDILSNGNQPELVCKHLSKLYDSLAKLKFTQEGGRNTKMSHTMVAKDGEEVRLDGICDCSGKVEVWLNRVTDAMRRTCRFYFESAVSTYDEKPREQWLFDYPAQPALCGTQIWWATEVNMAFAHLEEGFENALKDYQKKQISQLSVLIMLLLGDLTKGDRQKIMTICTIDVHSRDVVAKLIQQKVESASAFQWQSQLRHRWDQKFKDCFCNICDAQFRYGHEYLGNTPRLVITPLTDRCYITLTQSLHLIMGGAPAGPAGTGKTETTKDLGRAMGVMVYVFNCSEQMDYKSCGNIYKGLAQTGAWGCFDEFNRISVEVLSVVSVQVKSVLDAIKGKKTTFNFMGEVIALIPTVGMFITMNPGYAGRTELPENLKALFRPCAMVVPDFELICEIMLVAEGFQEARLLARKFITLYTLCRELLSKQDHYDWGLRAIKSVLVVAGSLKRSDRERPEDQVLMRALRDFNIPKIVTDDVPVFMGLIGDLFPALDVPRKRDLDFEKMVRQAAIDMKLQPEDNFILKVVQLQELLEVRHSVFIVGNAGTGKTMVWRTLFKTYQNMKRKPVYNDLNPKAVTNDELFGIINPATREWKDGLFSVIMRDQANLAGDGPKWIMLDGDIDPMWIESLNTVMDDNKVLTLASNERIALTPMMRLLFEISNLRTATPATVSRAGILYINPQDLGWGPFVASWIDKREVETEKRNLITLFDKYVPPCLDAVRLKFKKITPIPDISHIQMLCHLLDCLLTPTNLPPECPNEWYEVYFVFACIWAFGSALFQDQLVDHRVEFTKWWTNEFKTIKLPPQGTVFNYYIDNETKAFMPWTEKVKKFELNYDIPLQSLLVDTNETSRLRFFMDLLMEKGLPVMLVGTAGSGKSVIVAEKLSSLPEEYIVTNVPFNFYTTSEMLQAVLEKPLEKKAGRNYGPPGSKLMVYFVDDMNMPEVDTYGTVQPHTLIRQYIDYKHWYDRVKLSLKDIHNCQFVSCMNPTAGSFTINPRLQRHFSVFAVSTPSAESLFHIYHSILSQHLGNPILKFNPALLKITQEVVNAALVLHGKMGSMFLPTAVKFHYVFNLRDLSNIFQAMLFSIPECVPTPRDVIRLWIHEATRVYGDKLVDAADAEVFSKLIATVVKKGFQDLDENIFDKPLIFCHFAEGIGESKYLPISNWSQLSRLLAEALGQYNDLVAAMNLVMFEDAMQHVCRINRILEAPRGNALLVGVGGSGKQSLSRLSAFISSLEVFQIQLRKGYSMNDMKLDLAALYLKAGLKNVGIMFLMTDSQVAEEKFLVLVNDMLASGEIPGLFADDEIENIVGAMRNEVKAAGLPETKEVCWKFYIDRVRRLLKVVLCFSPVGSTLRVRARKFPAVVNCTSINWFQEWPQEALESVSERFLLEVEVLPEEVRRSVSLFMAYVHTVVNEMSQVYLNNEKRYNYTTPKTFLEQINLYSKLLNEKTDELQSRIIRLTNGLEKLASTAQQVDGLKETLAVQEVEVKEKNDAADKLIQVVSTETEKVSKEKVIAAEEERNVRIIEAEVSAKQKVCEEELMKAEPALLAAQEALNTLNKNNLTELKSFGAPPPAVVNVTAAVMVLFAPKGKIPKDRSWKACKVMMAKVDEFLNNLIYYDKEHIHPEVIKAIQPYLKDPEFVPENILSKSQAAAGLCAWVINIMKFYDVYVVVEPKRRALIQANNELQAAKDRLGALQEKLKSLEQQLGLLTSEFEAALAAKQKCQQEADATALTIDLANRLVNGLASENVRWRDSVANLKEAASLLPGDVLMVTAFISYVGCFTRQYRIDLQEKYWAPFIAQLEPAIPRTEGMDPLSLLTDDAQIAAWNNEGLPSDRMSAENATILTNSTRWPLMIDPQLQGIKWIKTKYGEELKIVRLGQKTCMDVIETSIAEGYTVLLENIGESVDAVLEPLLGRNLIKKGKAIKMGDKEVDYNPMFRLILQTKLANPHYKPEMQAQTTLINFTVTRDGLEEQILAEVVKAERPDLESLKSELTKQQNDFKITLKMLEDDLLQRLASAGDDILSDTTLVTNLETTKRTAAEIEVKVAEAKVTSVQIDEAREQYRPAATRASLLYFILNDLHKINPMYQFSLKAFSVVFQNAIAQAKPAEVLAERVLHLIDSITFCVFMYTSRGLFECDKLIFMAQMAIQILLTSNEIHPAELDFLLRFPANPNVVSPVDFLTNMGWGGIKTLTNMDQFKNLDRDIEGAAKRWKKYVEAETPEREKLPQDWKNKSALQRLCIMRSLRPDRMTYAVRTFIEEKLGNKYTEARNVEFAKSFQETTSTTPVFFILSPGVDPLKDVEKLGKKLGFTFDKRNFHNVSLGQGQEVVAEEAMEIASQKGHWVILQNIHLVKNWLPSLEKKMEQCSESAHTSFRLFMSAEPAGDPSAHIIPQGILESSIKITNEPPTGMLANLHKALDNFTQETLEMCSKETEFKAILFSLCYFHAVIAERRKFGPQGWNRVYPFNVGDLTISVNVLYNYLENSTKVPWEDLRYLFGEIMYGGHITDDWDRHLCRTYLNEYMKPELLDGDLLLAPGFKAPPNLDYQGYHNYIDKYLPSESPYLYGLHPNAEIGFLTTTSENLFRTLLEMQPRDAGASGATTMSREDKVKSVLEDIYDKLPEPFNIVELMAKVEDRTPYVIVAIQECERMNSLTSEMRRSLRELNLGLKGELTITSDMEDLEAALFMDTVPASWTKRAYPSMLTLGPWFVDFLLRLRELEEWSSDFQLPSAVWLAGFFNPQSFLTAIMQSTARKNEWPLDKMCLHTDVTKKQKEEFRSPPREGAYVHGLYMEGARWDIDTGGIVESRLKELFPVMPVVYIKAITQDKLDLRNMYECPVYKTRMRGPTYVWTFNLRTRAKPAKWTLAGVAILLQI